MLPQLHERKIGPLSGLSRETGWEIYAESKRRWMSGDLEFTHPGGESFADIRRRVLPVFEVLLARHPAKTIIVVAHGVVIRVVLLSLLEGLEPADFDRIAIDFASINDLRWDGRRWKADIAEPGGRPLAGEAGGVKSMTASDATGLCSGKLIPETKAELPDYHS